MEKSCCFPAATNPSYIAAAATSEASADATSAAADNFTNKTAHTPADNSSSDVSSGRSNTTNSLRALNRSSHKISKPISRNPIPNPLRPSLPPPSSITTATGSSNQQQQQQQQPPQPQPPVYNIDKNNFRDVVQKLTGSPAHLSSRPPPPAVAESLHPRPLMASQPLSRLHRIRPPPLAQLSPLPPAVPPAALAVGEGWIRSAPLSPLPPFPAVSAAAESPISAYMRRLRSGQPHPQGMAPLPPLSPLSFGCAPSPRTAAAYQVILSPTLLYSASPGRQIPSPKLGEP